MLPREASLDDKYTLQSGRAYMSGIEALVRLLMLQQQRDRAAGLNTAGFVSGYRGSPLGGLDQALWKARRHLDAHNVVFRPGVNEDLAMTAVRGTQEVTLFPGARVDGVYGMWYGKGPGLDRSMDVLKHANAVGSSQFGGVLAVVGDDHACKSSTLPHQCEHAFTGASAPVLNPANVQEILDLGVLGWELSRYSGCWVGFKVITENCDASASVDIDPSRVIVRVPEDFRLPPGGVHARWPDKPLAQEERLNHYKIYAAREFARVNNINFVAIDAPRPRLGIITTGKAYLDVLQGLEDLGIDRNRAAELGIRVFKVGMPWPLEPVGTHLFAEGLEEILVVEEKRSIIEDQLTGQLYNWPVERRPRVVGEFDEEGRPLLPNTAELTPAMVARAIASRIRRYYQSDDMQERLDFFDRKERSLAAPREIIERTPHYCSGCPHNTSTVVPEGSRALGGIGCHYMVTWMDRRTETFTQMGGEGASWIGQAPFTSTKHVFQNLGDGTYFHSGLLAIRAAVASKVNITYKLLYNDAVAMTGGQPVDGQLSVAQIVEQVHGEGVHRIALVSDEPDKYPHELRHFHGLTIHHRDDLEAVQREFRELPGCTLIIYDQTCAAEKRRRRKKGEFPDPDRRVFINELVCEGCGDCGVASNCLSVLPKETPFGRKRAIDQSACNKDFSCLKGFCPSFVTVEHGRLRKSRAAEGASDFAELPAPVLPSLATPWNTVITGIGGTGVLTVSAILGMAAHLEAKGCTVLNLSGLAQKFGPVVSHVRIGARQEDIHSVRVAAGDADLLLGCDLVVSAAEDPLAKLHDERSHAVVNDFEAPTAAFTRDPDVVFPTEAMKAKIRAEVGQEKTTFVDATAIATALLGDAIAANLFLLGFAFQRGLVPVSEEAITRAIELNGVQVRFNQQAFLWGRRAAYDEAAVRTIAGIGSGKLVPEPTLDALIAERERFLSAYQDAAWAGRYTRTVARVRAAETAQAGGGGELPFTRAVMRSLFKLMSYKDEYEVARLYTSGDFRRALEQQFEGEFTLKFHLAPPLFSEKDPVTGHLRKREYGPWMMRAFGLLARLRVLRGTRLDPFGYLAERRMERRLIADYESLLERLLPKLDGANSALISEIAALPLAIRGFGHVKERNLERALARQEELLMKLEAPASVVRIRAA
jgi:indolepyruvate ferredoxin oxidoreductase